MKDLSRLGRDLRRVLILDNSPASYVFHPDNAVSTGQDQVGGPRAKKRVQPRVPSWPPGLPTAVLGDVWGLMPSWSSVLPSLGDLCLPRNTHPLPLQLFGPY